MRLLTIIRLSAVKERMVGIELVLLEMVMPRRGKDGIRMAAAEL